MLLKINNKINNKIPPYLKHLQEQKNLLIKKITFIKIINLT
jgi:hypothetical protein